MIPGLHAKALVHWIHGYFDTIQKCAKCQPPWLVVSNAALPFPCQAMPRVPPPRRFAQPVRLLQTLSKLAEFGQGQGEVSLRGALCRSNLSFCWGRSVRGEGVVNLCTDLPLRADSIRHGVENDKRIQTAIAAGISGI